MANTLDLSFNDINKALNNANANYCSNVGSFFLFICSVGSSTDNTYIKKVFSLFNLSFEKIYNIDTDKYYMSSFANYQYSILNLQAEDLSKIIFAVSFSSLLDENETGIYSGYITRNKDTDDNYATVIYPMQRVYNFREVTNIIDKTEKSDIQTWINTNFKDLNVLKDASTRNIYMMYKGVYTPVNITVISSSTTSISISTNIYISGYWYNYYWYVILQGSTLTVSNLFYKSGQIPITINLDDSILTFDNMSDYEVMNTWLTDIFGTYDDAYIMEFHDNTRYTIMDSAGINTEVLTFNGQSAGGDNVKWILIFFDSGLNKIFKETITYNPTKGMLNVEKTNI